MIVPAALIADGAHESAELEFKQVLPDRSDRGRHEFLKDVCAMANSGGGAIYFGVAEENGAATELHPVSDESFDDTVRRLGQMLDSGIEPRLAGAEFLRFEEERGFILGLRVPPSFAAPHRYLFNGHSKFVLRNNTHVTEMNYDQLRSAFNRAGSLIERAEKRWMSDVQKASARQTWRAIEEGPLCVTQLLPLPSLEVGRLINLQTLHADFTRFMFPDWGGASPDFNLDGLVIYTGEKSRVIPAFVQVHRDGTVEAYRSARVSYRDEKLIPSETVAAFIRQSFFKFIKYARDYGIPGPYVFNSALLDVSEYQLAVDRRLFYWETPMADRKDLLLPSTYIESLPGTDDENVAREILDVLWQSFGLPRCTIYNDEGVWAPG